MESLQYSVILYTDAIWNALKWNFEMWYNIGYKVSWKPFVIFFFYKKIQRTLSWLRAVSPMKIMQNAWIKRLLLNTRSTRNTLHFNIDNTKQWTERTEGFNTLKEWSTEQETGA